MYDTEKRVELVKKRVHEKYRRKKRRGICRLSALCTALSAFLVGTVHTAAGQTQITARGMYGSILLHEDAGGYVLVGVISFSTAVMITVLCIRLREREHRGQGTGKGNASQQREGKINEKTKKTDLCGAALQFHGIFSGLHAGIGSRNRTADESPDIHRGSGFPGKRIGK